jgi:serine/threonine-protein kinase RsbW
MTGNEQVPPAPRTEPGTAAQEWEPPAVGGVVELTVPAVASFLPVVRAATAGLAARLSLTLDEIEDLRIAVDEACAMLLSLPAAEATGTPTLVCRYEVLADALAVRVSAPVKDGAALPAEQSFAWRVLTAHATSVSHGIGDGLAWIDLRKARH